MVQCGSQPPVAGYLTRYTDKGKAIIEKFRAEPQAKTITPAAVAYQQLIQSGNELEIKRPGDQKWLAGAAGRAIVMERSACTEVRP